ncbi:MAG: hypothetical protein ACPL6F_01875, partial [Anaerolineales bacterium]
AQERGLSADQFRTLMGEAAQEAVSKMVNDGVITQSQADWMLQRVQYMLQNGFGFGFGAFNGGCGGRSWWGR